MNEKTAECTILHPPLELYSRTVHLTQELYSITSELQSPLRHPQHSFDNTFVQVFIVLCAVTQQYCNSQKVQKNQVGFVFYNY